MEQSNVYLLMEKKRVYSQMELFKELRRMGWKQLNLQMDKRISSFQMVHALGNILMEESGRPILMGQARAHTDNSDMLIIIKIIFRLLF